MWFKEFNILGQPADKILVLACTSQWLLENKMPYSFQFAIVPTHTFYTLRKCMWFQANLLASMWVVVLSLLFCQSCHPRSRVEPECLHPPLVESPPHRASPPHSHSPNLE